MYPYFGRRLSDLELAGDLFDRKPIYVSKHHRGPVMVGQNLECSLEILNLEACTRRGLCGASSSDLTEHLITDPRLVGTTALPTAVFRDGRVGSHPVQPGGEHRIASEPFESPPRLEVRVLRSLGSVVGITEDPKTKRVHLPMRRLDELGPRSFISRLAAFDQLWSDELPRGDAPGTLRTPHDSRGYRGDRRVAGPDDEPRRGSGVPGRSI